VAVQRQPPGRSVPIAVNHSAPSGPDVMRQGVLPGARATEDICPSIVVRPMRSSPLRVNQMAPSGPGRDLGRSARGRAELPGCDGALWVSLVHPGQIARVTVRHTGARAGS
jgi:hypothetical protein